MALLRSVSAPDPGPLIHGGTIYLRLPQMADYMAWARVRAVSRGFLTPWEPSWSSNELTRTSYRRRVRHYVREAREDTGYAFFLFRTADDELLGGLTLSNVRRGVTQACTLGYWVGEPHAQQGHMTAGMRALIPFVFDGLQLHRLEAACLRKNTASTRLLEKCGFEQEGIAKRYLRINGIWQDHILYALIDDDPRP